ncbi:CBU_0592 family membrane protein [Pedobacter nyackensis]|uniref:CBU_0592 family membrane protein n=1 Tax=Pedobacter nyackensis TaxID=475255 RepID=UPI0039774DC8
MQEIIISGIGWLGVILCTGGYFLLSIKVLTAESRIFQLINVMGGLCLVTIALENSDMPNVMANLLWTFIGVYGLTRRLRTQGNVGKD